MARQVCLQAYAGVVRQHEQAGNQSGHTINDSSKNSSPRNVLQVCRGVAAWKPVAQARKPSQALPRAAGTPLLAAGPVIRHLKAALAHQFPAFMTTREPLLGESRLLGLHAALATKEEVSIAAAIATGNPFASTLSLLQRSVIRAPLPQGKSPPSSR